MPQVCALRQQADADRRAGKLQTTVYPQHVYLLIIQKPEIFASESLPISMPSEPRRYAHARKAHEPWALWKRSSVSRCSYSDAIKMLESLRPAALAVFAGMGYSGVA